MSRRKKYESVKQCKNNSLGKNSQELRLKQIVKNSITALVLGGILLALTIATSFYVVLVEEDQLETTLF